MGISEVRVPVALFLFNRPDMTSRVFERIRAARPSTLLVIGDGPRAARAGEAEKCDAARSVARTVDWECDVRLQYASTNLGCRRRVSSGLDWVFEQFEAAIILEDDCLPEPSFFPYCEELLARYRDDARVMAVSGDNFQDGRPRTGDSYYFSRFPHVWGWASWRRAWRYYDVDMKLWPQVRDGRWLDRIFPRRAARYWTRAFQATYEGKIDTWDYQWAFAVWIQSGLATLPAVNLISNIGFTSDATHTTVENRLANLPTAPLALPVRHPPFLMRHVEADDYSQQKLFSASFTARLRRKVASLWR